MSKHSNGVTTILILVLEASTSSAKAMLFKHGKGVLDTLQTGYSPDAGDTITFDADRVMDETLEAGRKLLRRNAITAVDMVATCSIWSHSLLLLDRQRKPVSRLSTWADTSASVTTDHYRMDTAMFNSLYQRTGCPIHCTYTLWKYMHARENGQLNNAAYIASMPEYLFLRLTGRFAVSRSTASAGGFLNLNTLNWDEEVLKLARVSEGMLPALVDSEFTAPLDRQAAERLGIKEGTPVLVTGADGCMNQIAAGGFGDSVMSLSVGTSAAIRLSTDRPVLSSSPSTWCYVGVENMWISGCATAGAGNTVDWMGKKIIGHGGEISLKELDRGAEGAIAKGEAPIFLPFLAGERCPGWDDTRSGALLEMKISNDIYDLYFATLEGVLFNLKQCYEIMLPIIGHPPKMLSVSGGIEKSPFWLQMAASIFGLPVYVERLANASMLGAAYMGLKAAGVIDSVKSIKPSAKLSYLPDPDKQRFFAERFERYLYYYAQYAKL